MISGMATHQDPAVYIIVITCNGKAFLKDCLTSVGATDYGNFRCVLLDNASSDGSSAYVSEAFPDVHIVRNDTNLGFAKGNNVAMRYAADAGADYVLLLNDDTVIQDSAWLRKAIAVAESNARVGMVGFEIVAPGTSAQGGAAVQEVSRINGCALLIRCSLLASIGLFDEEYFAYGEESDLEARALSAGYLLRQVQAPVVHLGGGSFGRVPVRRAYLRIRNWMRYSLKNDRPLLIPVRFMQIFCSACAPFLLPQRHRGDIGCHFISLVLNPCLFACALGWNLIFLPRTLAARIRDCRRVLAARQALSV